MNDVEASRFGWRSALAFFGLSAVLDVVMAGRMLGPVLAGELYNSDSYMRLDRLREIVERHAPVHIVSRDGSGTPTILHWSHLIDSLLLLIAAPLRLFMDDPAALFAAGVALGPISVGCLGAALAWMLAPLTAPEWRWTAPVLGGVSPSIAAYGLPGVVHHHVFLAVAAIMVIGWCGRGNRGGALAGWCAGLWGAVGIWFSPETMPFTLGGFGAIGLGWILGRREAAAALGAGGTALLLAIGAILAVDPPYGGLGTVQIERISVVYLVLGIAAAAIGWTLWACSDRPRTLPGRIALGAVVAGIGLGTWLALFPSVLKGPDGLMTPEETHAMFGAIAEMQPIQGIGEGVAFLSTGLLSAMVLATYAWRRHSLLWAYAALCALIVVALGAWHVRFATYAASSGAACLPLALTMIVRSRWAPAAQSLGRVAVLALFLLAPFATQIGSAVEYPSNLANADAAIPCPLRSSVGLLAPYAGQAVIADPAETPELIYRTGVLTIGSLYRNIDGFMRLRAAWRSGPSADMPAAVRSTGATLILACPTAVGRGKRSLFIADLPPDTLLDRLNRGDVPPWLRLIGRDPGGHVLYAINGNPT